MESPLLLAISRAEVLMRQAEVLANNIANVNTTGFKRQSNLFNTFVVQPKAGESIDFVIDSATVRDARQGSFVQTGNALDVALSGPGFLAVETPQGTRYTRAGNLTQNELGELITASGQRILAAGNEPIVIPADATDIKIKGDGTIETAQGVVGNLGVFEFASEQAMLEEGSGFYNPNGQEAVAAQNTRVQQGMLEQSNVQPVIEMSQMLEVSRSFQSAQRMIDSENERLRNAIRTLGRVA